MALPATDNFNRAEDPIASGWGTGSYGFGNMRAASNVCTRSGVVNGGCYWTADAFASNQYSQAVPVNFISDSGPSVRMQLSGTQRNFYYLENRLATIQRVKKSINDTVTQLGSNYTPSLVANTTVTKIRISGTTLTVSNDGVDASPTQTDAALSGGAAGLVDFAGQQHDNWEGGDVAGGSLAAGSWNGLLLTKWNGIAITSWNGTAIRLP